MKDFLIVTHKGHFIEAFLMHNIEMLQNEGFTVHCASNYTEELDAAAKVRLESLGIITHQIDIIRSPYSPANLFAYQQLKALMDQYDFACVHCHTPTGGVLARLAARKKRKEGTKVFYTAHGFHFYRGAPPKNWLLYYPVEWVCAHWTDVLITINKEDYERAKKHMHAGRVEYVPGVGVDIKKFSPTLFSSEEIAGLRAELGLDAEDKMLLSVGELIPRKNHEAVIRAIAKLNHPHVRYCICGSGELKEYLENLIAELKLSDQIELLGYRSDISKLCACADLFVFPSLQEGLPVALMEAVASKTPAICSNIRGNNEFIQGDALFDPHNASEIAAKIEEYLCEDKTEEVNRNYHALQQFDLSKVLARMYDCYENLGGVEYLKEQFRIQALRREMGVPQDAKLLLSVGELNYNKNHEAVLRALALLNDISIHYAIAGVGSLKNHLEDTAKELGIADRLHLLGFRRDILFLYGAADLYVHSSFREGLSVALMEAIASKTPVICSNTRGNTDLVSPNALFEAKNIPQIAERIDEYLKQDHSDEIERNYLALESFGLEQVKEEMMTLYSNMEGGNAS